MAITDKPGKDVEQLRRESVVTRLRMAQQGGYDGSTGFVRGNVYQLFGVEEKSYDGVYFLVGNIATEVDREIASAKSAAYDQGYAAGYDAGFASADDWCAQHEDAMAEHGWYRALDADKQPIKLGDEVYQVKGGWVYTVKSITLYPDNTTVSFECKHGYGCDNAHSVRHYHAPTVEDVLTEFAAKLIERGGLTNGAAQTIAEYAKRLQLREGDES